jgi:hypothetical protein
MKRITRASVFAKKLSTLLAKAVRLPADCACQSPDIILLDSNTNPVPIGAQPFNPSSEFTASGIAKHLRQRSENLRAIPDQRSADGGFGISSLFTIFVARQNGWPRLCLNNRRESLGANFATQIKIG